MQQPARSVLATSRAVCGNHLTHAASNNQLRPCAARYGYATDSYCAAVMGATVTPNNLSTSAALRVGTGYDLTPQHSAQTASSSQTGPGRLIKDRS
jgi:hypothetical protein